MQQQVPRQPQPITTNQRNEKEGIGFVVENLLNDFNNEDGVKHEAECDQREKRYDEIKQSILSIYKKIKQRKNYNCKHKANNNVALSYMNYSKIREQYRDLLNLLYKEKENSQTKHRANWHIAMLYRLFAQTRDISDGCGERELAYMQLFELARQDAACANRALETVVFCQCDDLKKTKPLGSWKDVKGLVAYMRGTINVRDERDMTAYLELTKCAVKLVNERLAKDVLAFYREEDNEDAFVDDDEVSFVSKWIPRENKSKKYGNFYERLACDYYKDWLPKDRDANPVSYEKAVIKCKIHYRKLVSFLNQYLETPQIKMCEQRWSEIAFSKTTRLTRDLQRRALLNLKPDEPSKRHVQNLDREACAEKYKAWNCNMMNYQNGIKTDLTTHVAVSKYYSSCSSLSVNRNAEWAAFASQEALKNKLSRVIPVIAGNSNNAIGLAVAVAENAATGRTLILKDGEEFVLHDLDASFVKNVKYLKSRARQWCGKAQLPSVHGHPMYKCLISALKLLVESNVAAKETRDSEERKNEFTVTVFADDDESSGMFNDDVSFGEVLNEARLLYREFGYGVPNVVLWAMASSVCVCDEEGEREEREREDREREDRKREERDHDYESVSYGGNLTIRVGCNASDICAYLGVENKKEKGRHKEWPNEWPNEWNCLVETLYNERYRPFENITIFFEKK